VKEIGVYLSNLNLCYVADSFSKRYRTEHKNLHDLVFVKYNQQLKQRDNARDGIHPISLKDIDMCWLVGEMDDDDNGTENELVFYDDNALNWDT